MTIGRFSGYAIFIPRLAKSLKLKAENGGNLGNGEVYTEVGLGVLKSMVTIVQREQSPTHFISGMTATCVCTRNTE